MDYAVHTMPSYQHMQGTPKRAHEGSQSQGHMAGGNAGWHSPSGGNTSGSVGSGGKKNLGM